MCLKMRMYLDKLIAAKAIPRHMGKGDIQGRGLLTQKVLYGRGMEGGGLYEGRGLFENDRFN